MDADTLLYSLHAGVYLANTKTLAWLSAVNGKDSLVVSDKTKVLALLQSEVNTANELTNKIIRLLWRSHQGQPCDKYPQLLDDVIEDLRELMSFEKMFLLRKNEYSKGGELYEQAVK